MFRVEKIQSDVVAPSIKFKEVPPESREVIVYRSLKFLLSSS